MEYTCGNCKHINEKCNRCIIHRMRITKGTEICTDFRLKIYRKTRILNIREIKRRSKKQEENTAKRLKGRVQPASGAFSGLKGDVATKFFLVEDKRTDKKSIVLHADWLENIYEQARRDGKSPLLELEINKRIYYIICKEDLEGLLDNGDKSL